MHALYKVIWRPNVHQEHAMNVYLYMFYVLVFVEFDLKGSYHVYEGIWVAKVWENLQITNQRGPRGGPNLWAKVVPSWQHTVSMFTDYFTASCVDHGP